MRAVCLASCPAKNSLKKRSCAWLRQPPLVRRLLINKNRLVSTKRMHMAVAQASKTAGGTPRPKKWVTFLRNNASLLLIYGLILIVGIYAAAKAENFRTMSNMANIGRQTILLGMIAIGQSVVILSGGIDFSVAMIARVVALTVATIFAAQDSNPALI